MVVKSNAAIPFTNNASIHAGNIHSITLTTSAAPGESYKEIDITGAVTELYFYESVLATTVTATIVLMDTGFEIPKGAIPGNIKGRKRIKSKGILDSIVGGERIDFKIEDNNPNNASNPDLKRKSIIQQTMYVNRIRDISNSTLKNTFALDLVSSAFLSNERVRVLKRYDGPIDKSITDIIKLLYDEGYGGQSSPGSYDIIQEIQRTKFNYSFIGNTKKPLHVCSWLASKAVPEDPISANEQSQAGYFFYQTRNGFHFVSVDARLNGYTFFASGFDISIRKKLLYNNTGRMDPENYDANILSYSTKRTVDLQKDLALGVYNNYSQFFDFYAMNYRIRPYDAVEDMSNLLNSRQSSKSQLNLPDRNVTEYPSRFMTHILDVGTLPEGVNSTQQLEKWKSDPTAANYKAEETMVQSIMRYNQLFSMQTSVIIPGDFTISAGDNVVCSIEALNPDTNVFEDNVSGSYLVCNVCHKITPTETFTSMDLIKDTRL